MDGRWTVDVNSIVGIEVFFFLTGLLGIASNSRHEGNLHESWYI